ncbi:MAG: hypothetical protein HZA93_23130 [Verrucomicrobia bacterium]|nr:hypothetical protein [Verrucomicrobiota bacterium]
MAAGHLKSLAPLADALADAATQSALTARARLKSSRRRGIGAALRPGPETPLWNELAAAVAREIHRRGEKAKLARLLGISRQRLHVLIGTKTACPDAERALAMLAWLQARRRGGDPA